MSISKKSETLHETSKEEGWEERPSSLTPFEKAWNNAAKYFFSWKIKCELTDEFNNDLTTLESWRKEVFNLGDNPCNKNDLTNFIDFTLNSKSQDR